jgi:hypothetical protein
MSDTQRITLKSISRLFELASKPNAQILVYSEDQDKAVRFWSCSQCGGTGDGATPASIRHESCCVYVGGKGC